MFTEEVLSQIPSFDQRFTGEAMTSIDITREAVLVKLKNLIVTKSAGPDNIHPRILSEIADEIADPLVTIYKKSLEAGILPSYWKLGSIVPIFKKGRRDLPQNYRPVSLTSILSKIIESLIRDQLLAFLIDEGLLAYQQHGFRPGRSCETQLLEVLDDWTSNIENGTPTDVIYLDFRKAFDSVPHQRLLLKLRSYGVDGKLLSWIEDFLSERRQRVVVNGRASGWIPVDSGVPQRSVLGPLLFLLCINDLPDGLQCSVRMFADDSKIFSSVQNDADFTMLQSDIDQAVAWSDRWQMPFNEKCEVLQIGYRTSRHEYSMRGKKLSLTYQEKDLGVVIDSELKFKQQAALAVSKANQILAVIRRSFCKIDVITLPILFKALVRPHLEYGNVIWGPFTRGEQQLVERVQRRATKLVPELRDTPYPERLRKLKLPSLYYRRRRGDMVKVFQLIHGLICIDSSHLLEIRTESRTRGHPFKLVMPIATTRPRRNSFGVRVVKDWNELPHEVVMSNTLNQFKARIDKHWTNIMYEVPVEDR